MGETWADRVRQACQAVPVAEAQRAQALGEAMDAGFSVRQIAVATGVPPMTIWRWAGNRGRIRRSLDEAVEQD